eukprot:COSAG01_NODE_2730_length_7172_cov_35.156087_4_plen_99_part_00
MGHTVERRPRGAGRPPSTHPSRIYRSATRVHVQARLRMQDAPDVHLGAEHAALRRELLPKQQHQLVSRLPRQHDCVDYHGHGGFWGSTCGQCCERGAL